MKSTLSRTGNANGRAGILALEPSVAISYAESVGAYPPSVDYRHERQQESVMTKGHRAMRHTGQWWQVYADLTVDEALDIIREHPLFQP